MNQNKRDYPEHSENYDPYQDFAKNQETAGRGARDYYPEKTPFEDIGQPNWSQQDMTSTGYTPAPGSQNQPYQGYYGEKVERRETDYATLTNTGRHYYDERRTFEDQGTGQQTAQRPSQQAGPRPREGRPGPQTGRSQTPRYRRGAPQAQGRAGHTLTKILDEFSKFFKNFFSRQPADALKQDLSTLSWVILFVANILFYALAKATVFVNSALGIMEDLFGSLGISAGSGGWGKAFGLGIIEQIVVLLLFFLASFVLAGTSRENKLPPVQYLKLLSYATPLHSLISFILIFVSLFAAEFAAIILGMNNYLLFFSFTYTFDTVYAKERKSRYWLYFILLLALTLLSMIL